MRVLPKCLIYAAMFVGAANAALAAPPAWETLLMERVPLYGHRNWIVIADSAYPAQSREGIETIVADTSQERVLNYVLGILSASKHVRPIVYMDKELKFVPESDASGISAYRRELQSLFANQAVMQLPHEQIIAKLDQTAQTFRVLIIKTRMTIPYTTVFLQLDCAYWGTEAELRMRAAIAAGEPQ